MAIKKRIATFILLLALMFTIGGEFFSAFCIKASAAGEVLSYDDSPIESDIANMEESEYPANPLGECSIIGFMEYCYSENSEYASAYGLYIYVYNPTERPLLRSEGANQISISTSFGENGEQASVGNAKLVFLDHTENFRFYKFKIIDRDINGTDAREQYNIAKEYAALWSGVRRYEITSLDVHFEGEKNPEDSLGISKIYEFSGYAAYCEEPSNSISTLSCQYFGGQDIHLEVYDTNYRFAEKEDYLRDDLQSVYFSVPNSYMEQWGDLHEITAEWYQYKTSPMFVTSDSGAYSALYELRNMFVNEYGYISEPGFIGPSNLKSDWRVFWEEFYYMGTYVFKKAYGPYKDTIETGYAIFSPYYIAVPKLDWLFFIEDPDSNDDYDVPAEEVRKYIENYTSEFSSSVSKLHGKYAETLFEREDGDGYRGRTFNISEKLEYKDSDKNQSSWSKFWFGTDIDTVTYSPIVTISPGDFYLSSKAFSEKYLVDEDDVEDIIQFSRSAYENRETPLLLRFALNDYYSSEARFDLVEEGDQEMSSIDGYVAQEMVYLEFDILSLSFSKDGGYSKKVIGVVANSIDIINGLTAPEGLYEEQEWWQKLMLILTIILLVVCFTFFSGPLGFVFNILWTGIKFLVGIVIGIIKIPFKLLGYFFKSG